MEWDCKIKCFSKKQNKRSIKSSHIQTGAFSLIATHKKLMTSNLMALVSVSVLFWMWTQVYESPIETGWWKKNESEKKLYHSCFAFALKPFVFIKITKVSHRNTKDLQVYTMNKWKVFPEPKPLKYHFKYKYKGSWTTIVFILYCSLTSTYTL